MISILRSSNKTQYRIRSAVLLCALLLPLTAGAQQSLSLSVTPTLFEMSANPGQVWESSVKVINSNPYDIEVYASAVNFAPQGESGHGKLIPVFEEMTEGSTLAEWIDISSEPITVPREQSMQVPFIVEVPEDASPGGHFAAILISTKPPERQPGQMFVSTTQIVTSLFFVRIAGDVIEKGSIRSFTTAERFVQSPQATFEMRFENDGNVHLQPRGDITIYNMWGAERGTIPINHKTHFGNVLPDSIRKFEFTWDGEQSFTDFGRYTAVASLAYGSGEKQFATSSTYFWVIPVKPLLITLAILFAFIFFVFFAVRLYVRRMLQLSGVPVTASRPSTARESYVVQEGDVRVGSYQRISAPVRSGYLDLRRRLQGTQALFQKLRALSSFVAAYKWFFIFALVLISALVLLVWFIQDATETDRSYNITIENPGASLDLSSEEIRYEEQANVLGLPSIGQLGEQSYALDLVNTSGEPGIAGKTAVMLGRRGYAFSSISSGEGRVDKTSVIVFDPALQVEAVKLSQLLGGALLSARTSSSSTELPNITIYVGSDQRSD